MTGLGPLIGGGVALYGYYRWRQLLRFLEYFRQLQQYDLAAKGLVELESLPHDHIERTRQLEEELVQLQQRVVGDFCRNYFYGEGVLANFLSLMNATRDFLRHSRLRSLAGDLSSSPVQHPSAGESIQVRTICNSSRNLRRHLSISTCVQRN